MPIVFCMGRLLCRPAAIPLPLKWFLHLAICLYWLSQRPGSALVKEMSDFHKDPSDIAELLNRTFLTLLTCEVVSIFLQKFRHELVLLYPSRFSTWTVPALVCTGVHHSI